MRQSIPLCQSSRCRLLTLLLILLLGYLGAHTVNGSPANLGNISEYSRTITGGTPYLRIYYLNSRCSERNVQMRLRKGKNQLNAYGPRHSDFVPLQFESQGQGLVRIFGVHAQKYICFSRRGKLILRTNHANDGRCMFREDLEDNFTMLQSQANVAWYVGFNKRGKKMKGFAISRRKRRKCFQFRKVPYTRTRHTHRRHGPLADRDPSEIATQIATVLENR